MFAGLLFFYRICLFWLLTVSRVISDETSVYRTNLARRNSAWLPRIKSMELSYTDKEITRRESNRRVRSVKITFKKWYCICYRLTHSYFEIIPEVIEPAMKLIAGWYLTLWRCRDMEKNWQANVLGIKNWTRKSTPFWKKIYSCSVWNQNSEWKKYISSIIIIIIIIIAK